MKINIMKLTIKRKRKIYNGDICQCNLIKIQNQNEILAVFKDQRTVRARQPLHGPRRQLLSDPITPGCCITDILRQERRALRGNKSNCFQLFSIGFFDYYKSVC